MTATLFETIPEPRLAQDVLGSGTAVLNGFALEVEAELVSALKAIVEARTLPPNCFTWRIPHVSRDIELRRTRMGD